MNDKTILRFFKTWGRNFYFILIPFFGAILFAIIFFNIEYDEWYLSKINITFLSILLIAAAIYFKIEQNRHVLKSIAFASIFYYECASFYNTLHPKTEAIITFYEVVRENIFFEPILMMLDLGIVLLVHGFFWTNSKRNS